MFYKNQWNNKELKLTGQFNFKTKLLEFKNKNFIDKYKTYSYNGHADFLNYSLSNILFILFCHS